MFTLNPGNWAVKDYSKETFQLINSYGKEHFQLIFGTPAPPRPGETFGRICRSRRPRPGGRGLREQVRAI
jgi:hypothetical protein